MPPSVSREVLARSQWALYPPALVGGGALGLVAATSDDPVSVFTGAALLLGALLLGAARSGRVRTKAGVVTLTEQEWDLALGVQGARLDGRVDDDVVPLVAALCDAVRTGQQPAVDRATSDLRALVRARGLAQ